MLVMSRNIVYAIFLLIFNTVQILCRKSELVKLALRNFIYV